jgi:Asp/Glu/hydantoin racemase
VHLHGSGPADLPVLHLVASKKQQQQQQHREYIASVPAKYAVTASFRVIMLGCAGLYISMQCQQQMHWSAHALLHQHALRFI